MVRRTPNGFEQFVTSLHEAFLLFYALAVLYRVVFSQNVHVIVTCKNTEQAKGVVFFIHRALMCLWLTINCLDH